MAACRVAWLLLGGHCSRPIAVSSMRWQMAGLMSGEHKPSCNEGGDAPSHALYCERLAAAAAEAYLDALQDEAADFTGII